MPSDTDNPSIVILKKEWDYLPHIVNSNLWKDQNSNLTAGLQENNDNNKANQDLHCHVIRKIERDYLMDFFRRRREGALLVCGRRGVGKTSAIAAAILASRMILGQSSKKKDQSDAQADLDGMALLPILINAPNFEIHKSQTGEKQEPKNADPFLEFKRLVLQNLVRGLYQSAVKCGIMHPIDIGVLDKSLRRGVGILELVKNLANRNKILRKNRRPLTKQEIDLRNAISHLFRRAVAKEVKTQSNFKEMEIEKYLIEKQSTYTMDWSLVATTTALSVFSGITVAYFLPKELPETLTQILPIIISVIPPSIAMSWQVRKITTNQTEAEKNASIYYLYDYDLSTLQAELEEVIRKLTENNYKVIFIIDELDKIDETGVIEVIKSLKSLLNQASALFVLISGHEFFRVIMDAREERGKEYTLFSQKIFLRRPQLTELKKFMDNIVDSSTTQPLIKLFEWDEIQERTTLGEILKRKSIDDKHLQMIEDADVSKAENAIKISITREVVGDRLVIDNKYTNTIEIKDDASKPDEVLRIPSSGNTNESIEYEFAVMKDDNSKSFVYTRTKEYSDFQLYAA